MSPACVIRSFCSLSLSLSLSLSQPLLLYLGATAERQEQEEVCHSQKLGVIGEWNGLDGLARRWEEAFIADECFSSSASLRLQRRHRVRLHQRRKKATTSCSSISCSSIS